jgi:hypothetical protein
MEKENVLTVRERMENVLRSAGEALVNGMNLKTVVRQLDESGLKVVQSWYSPVENKTGNEYAKDCVKISNQNEIEFTSCKFSEFVRNGKYDRQDLVYLLSVGFDVWVVKN